MAVQRMQLQTTKRGQKLKNDMRTISEILEQNKEESARIKTEAIIREENLDKAFEILSLYCELIVQRIDLIDASKQIPPDLMEAICSLIYSTHRVDIPEFHEVGVMFVEKYTEEWVKKQIINYLSIHPPSYENVTEKLVEIASLFNIDYIPKPGPAPKAINTSSINPPLSMPTQPQNQNISNIPVTSQPLVPMMVPVGQVQPGMQPMQAVPISSPMNPVMNPYPQPNPALNPFPQPLQNTNMVQPPPAYTPDNLPNLPSPSFDPPEADGNDNDDFASLEARFNALKHPK